MVIGPCVGRNRSYTGATTQNLLVVSFHVTLFYTSKKVNKNCNKNDFVSSVQMTITTRIVVDNYHLTRDCVIVEITDLYLQKNQNGKIVPIW